VGGGGRKNKTVLFLFALNNVCWRDMVGPTYLVVFPRGGGGPRGGPIVYPWHDPFELPRRGMGGEVGWGGKKKNNQPGRGGGGGPVKK